VLGTQCSKAAGSIIGPAAFAGYTKIGEFDPPVCRNQHIARFQVTVDYLPVAGGCEGGSYIGGHSQGTGQGEAH
jgi:hypothetical protein